MAELPTNPVTAPARLLLDEPTARAELGNLSGRTLFTLRKSGALPFVRIGSRIFYKREDLERFIAARRQGGIDAKPQ